jgi:hypothetical protein
MFMPEGNGYAPGVGRRKANDNRPLVHRINAAVIILEITGVVAVASGRPVAPAHEDTPAAGIAATARHLPGLVVFIAPASPWRSGPAPCFSRIPSPVKT